MLNLITNIHVYAVHEGTEKPFKCDNRDATFDYPQNIDRHVTGVHEGKKQLKCDYRFTGKHKQLMIQKEILNVTDVDV